MKYEFTFNNIDVEVDTVNMSITIPDPNRSNILRKYLIGDYRQNPHSKSIIVTNYMSYTDINGVEISSDPPITRSYNRTQRNSQGVVIFDFFANLVSNLNLLELTIFATVNNQLENMIDIFEDACPCFNPYNNWEFFHPIQLLDNGVDIIVIDETESLNDGIIALEVGNKVDGYSYEYSIDGGVTWQSGGVFENLSANTYTVLARSTNEMIPSNSKSVIVGLTNNI